MRYSSAELADESVESRREGQSEDGDTEHSREHGGAEGLPHLSACPGRNGERGVPRMKASDVIRIGRRRMRAAAVAASSGLSLSWSCRCRANSGDSEIVVNDGISYSKLQGLFTK